MYQTTEPAILASMTSNPDRPLGPLAAGALTFFAAATVLVLEIAAGRLLAPYVGVSLNTYTGIIGVILAGIALGAWLGGRAADTYGPLTLLGPTLVVGGLASALAVPVVDLVGAVGLGDGIGAIVLLATLGFVAPAAMLSAVAPMVVRATISDVASSGTLVGRLSAIGTAGAITGTFLTGFVLLGALPTRAIIIGAGGLAVLVGAWLTWRGRGPGRRGRTEVTRSIGGALLGLVVVGGVAVAAPGPCERESAYYCIAVVEDPGRPTGRTLVLDRLRHAYVDLADPTHVEFGYLRSWLAALEDVIETHGDELDVLHIGGGGFTFPRWLDARSPGSSHTILELDPVVYDVARTELGFVPSATTDVRLGDARLSIRRLPDDAFDIAAGDAFGGLSVPWHLTTVEFVDEVDRVLRPDGRYVMNLIDGPGLRFALAETATLLDRFEHVAVIAPGSTLAALEGRAAGGGGNVVLVASHVPLDLAAIEARARRDGHPVRVLTGDAALALAGDVRPLTDDWAPVDQLIGR